MTRNLARISLTLDDPTQLSVVDGTPRSDGMPMLHVGFGWDVGTASMTLEVAQALGQMLAAHCARVGREHDLAAAKDVAKIGGFE